MKANIDASRLKCNQQGEDTSVEKIQKQLEN
jgi:hypothetical protein